MRAKLFFPFCAGGVFVFVFALVFATDSASATESTAVGRKTEIKSESKTVIEPNGDTSTSSETVTSETTTEPTGEKTAEPTGEKTTETKSFRNRVQKTAEHTEEAVQGSIANAGDRRAASSLSAVLEYSPLDLILPSKTGGALGYVRSRESTYEIEYIGASLGAPFFMSHIGGFDDQRVALIYRSYSQRNSFNFHFGLDYFNTGIHIGSDLLRSSTNLSAFDHLLRARALGVEFGIGNRWILPHGFTVGLDWFSWAQPLIVLDEDSSIINTLQDGSDKGVLESTFHLAMFFPRLVVLKLGLGWTF